jgi:hypothetical protein
MCREITHIGDSGIRSWKRKKKSFKAAMCEDARRRTNERDLGHPLGEDAWQSSSAIGRSSTGGLYRYIGNQDIGDPGHKGLVHRRIAKHDFPIRHQSTWGHTGVGGRQVAHHVSGARKWKSRE